MFLFISGPEIVFILFIVVMVFGADKIPGIAKGMAKGMRQLKDATNDIKHEIQKSAEDHGVDSNITKDIQEEIDAVKKEVKDITQVSGSVKRNS